MGKGKPPISGSGRDNTPPAEPFAWLPIGGSSGVAEALGEEGGSREDKEPERLGGALCSLLSGWGPAFRPGAEPIAAVQDASREPAPSDAGRADKGLFQAGSSYNNVATAPPSPRLLLSRLKQRFSSLTQSADDHSELSGDQTTYGGGY
ncbi:G-protein coupled receptor 98 [Platysternon megacephalum]|uniref:G-protein coupled receptor 98 n=1 Tax=Platysternon megacephalum TaxID=55544 RepID=A0A4D9EZR7_9SAUR|nr:G-protein coupled receptor 98 [Platysternon megacephalum]